MLKAFTMAEVLITLGILGVVIAMTLPGLINDSRYAAIEASLKKNYTITQQALLQMGEDEGEIIKADYGFLLLESKLKTYYKLGLDCNGMDYRDICWHPSDNSKPQYYTFNGHTKAKNSILDDGAFVTNDGSLYLFENAGGGNNHTTYITIDTNSILKGPNQWGKDLFTFQITNDGKFLPMGAQGTHYTDLNTYCSATSTSDMNGIACTYRALTEKDYFKNLAN